MSQKSEVFNVTQTNFFNIAKSTKFLDVTNIKFHMSQRLTEAATEGAL